LCAWVFYFTVKSKCWFFISSHWSGQSGGNNQD
jgi:hypothetical protein